MPRKFVDAVASIAARLRLGDGNARALGRKERTFRAALHRQRLRDATSSKLKNASGARSGSSKIADLRCLVPPKTKQALDVPFLVPHCKRNAERHAYLMAAFSKFGLQQPNFITAFDPGDFSDSDVYFYDEAQYRKCLEPIRNILVSRVIGLVDLPSATWATCLDFYERLNFDLDDEFARSAWIRPRELSEAEISLFLKHRAAWKEIADASSPYGIVAEDDILFFDHSGAYFDKLIANLPADFDYIDLVGGCGLRPRIGDRVINEIFFETCIPSDRTSCCALISRGFARRLISLDLPICLPIDWTLTLAFQLTKARVYWLEPPLFAHGSEMGIYRSGIR